MWGGIGSGAVAALIAGILFRLRHREPIYRSSYPWIGLVCLAEGLVAAGLNASSGAVTGVSSRIGVTALSAGFGIVLPIGASTGIGKSDTGKRRLQLHNGFSRLVDKLIRDQSAAGTAMGQARDVQLLLGRTGDPNRLGHPLFDEYVVHLRQRRLSYAKQQKVRNIAKDSSPLEERLAAVLGIVIEEGHWEFYRSERKVAKKVEKEGKRNRRPTGQG